MGNRQETQSVWTGQFPAGFFGSSNISVYGWSVPQKDEIPGLRFARPASGRAHCGGEDRQKEDRRFWRGRSDAPLCTMVDRETGRQETQSKSPPIPRYRGLPSEKPGPMAVIDEYPKLVPNALLHFADVFDESIVQLAWYLRVVPSHVL